MSRMSLLNLVAAGVLLAGIAEPAFAQRGDRGNHHRGDDRDRHRGGDRDNNWNRNHGRDWNRHDGNYRRHDHDDWRLNFNFGVPYYGYHRSGYDYYRVREPVYYNGWGLVPLGCRECDCAGAAARHATDQRNCSPVRREPTNACAPAQVRGFNVLRSPE